MAEIDLPRLVRALPRHVEFFQVLERQAGEEQWTPALMLRVFGTAKLRKFELPVRWMQSSGAVEITAQEKEASAEMGRSQALVATAPPESVARRLLDGFYVHLDAKVRAGKMRPKSMRLSLRPAVSLLERADAQWQRMPDQAAVVKFLEATPGQRAALSTFLGFLKDKHGVELSRTVTGNRQKSDSRKRVGMQLAVLAREQPRKSNFESRWLCGALAYFHDVSATQAKRLLKAGSLVEMDVGHELVVDGARYWIPKPPGEPPGVRAT